MIIALDKKADQISPPNIQLRTPLTRYKKSPDLPWVLDNGCFTHFDEKVWLRMVEDAFQDPNCYWFVMPDEVGNHVETKLLFYKYSIILERRFSNSISNKACFVIQDGCTIDKVPWDEITAVFLGGSTDFKMSREAYAILREARNRVKWVHVGRVNTPDRMTYFHDIADSVDGSGLSKYSWMLNDMEKRIDELEGTTQLHIDDGYLHYSRSCGGWQ